MREKEVIKEVAYKDNTVAKENLPLPIVYYPGFYGAFFGFAEHNCFPISFCSCTRVAIENYIKFRLSSPISTNVMPGRSFILDSMYFPKIIVDKLIEEKIPENKDIVNCLVFKNNICHECNRVVPSYRYCVEMYGGVFKQNYGWYINKQAYEFGIEPISSYVIQDICPQEVLDIIELDPFHTPKILQELAVSDFKKADALSKKFQKQNRKIWNIIENEVRRKFNHKKIGDAWTSETILYHIICSLFPKHKVHRHYRPEFLKGLELDIYIEELKLGIEYQGIQHFEPISYWGGEEALKKLQIRDKKKQKLAMSNAIPLVYFTYEEHLNDAIVIQKIKPYIKNK